MTRQESGGSMGTSAFAGSISIPITIEADAQTRTVEAPGRFPVNGDVVCSDPVNLEVDTARKPDIRYQNIPLRLDGTEVMFRKITVKPAEIVLDISIIPPDGMENWKDVAQLDFKAYLDGAQMKHARVEYARWYFGDGRTYQMRFVIPFPPADPGTLELVPVMSYMEKVNGAPPENELFSVDREAGDTVQQKEQVLEGSKITIDLSK